MKSLTFHRTATTISLIGNILLNSKGEVIEIANGKKKEGNCFAVNWE